MTNRQLFLQHVAQTSPAPIGLEIVKAQGTKMWDAQGKAYYDLISGFSVMNLGHGNEAVKAAIKKQVDDYMHLMVYGEIIETPQVAYAKKLTEHLPPHLNCVYFTNSGTEATEGAMKLAKRLTGRTQILAFNNSYHGSTQGALSIMGHEYWRNAYRPLLPDVLHLNYNCEASLDFITPKTACIVMETVQAEAGVVAPQKEWIQAIRKKCSETGTLLILDEIQTGFGRTGPLWAFEQYDISPDILLLGKALGGGMPLGAFIASYETMQCLTHQPVLGHISTFAGHPVCCAAGMAAFDELLKLGTKSEEKNTGTSPLETLVIGKEKQFISLLTHHAIKAIRSKGLLMALEFENDTIAQTIIHDVVKRGAITDWFLFAGNCLRIAPPLTITDEEIAEVCQIIHASIDAVLAQS